MNPTTTGNVADFQNPDPLFKRKPASDYTETSVPKMDRMRMNGTGPAYVKIGASIFYRQSALDAWIASHEVHPGAA